MNLEDLDLIRKHLNTITDICKHSKEYTPEIADSLERLFNIVEQRIKDILWKEHEKEH